LVLVGNEIFFQQKIILPCFFICKRSLLNGRLHNPLPANAHSKWLCQKI
jgi:hypothetical protein